MTSEDWLLTTIIVLKLELLGKSPPALLSSDPINPINESNITARSEHLASLHANNSQTRSKKQELHQRRAQNALRKRKASTSNTEPSTHIPRSLTPPLMQMELIRPGKRKVRILANAVENTPPKRMRAV